MFDDAYDNGLEHQKIRLVKCRKPHICNCGCDQEIAKGEIALLESGIYDGEPRSWYAKLKCVEDWLEESEQIPQNEMKGI